MPLALGGQRKCLTVVDFTWPMVMIFQCEKAPRPDPATTRRNISLPTSVCTRTRALPVGVSQGSQDLCTLEDPFNAYVICWPIVTSSLNHTMNNSRSCKVPG